jgi:DNA polymerase I-like protein with 3'-5' exonuclease and polymerase domains
VIWDPATYLGFDFETSGTLPEYALQPWRVRQQKAWPTSLVWVKGEDVLLPNVMAQHPGDLPDSCGGLRPDRAMMVKMLEQAIREKRRLVGWNTVFDIAWLLAEGLEDLVFQCKWLDGMLLWRHYAVEPEYEMSGPSKKKFGLKSCVTELWPAEAGYEEDVDFHDTSLEARAKLHTYNIRDVAFTLRAARHWWDLLAPAQQRSAIIEAECLPWIAAANLQGIPIDTLVLNDLRLDLMATAEDRITRLAMYGVTPAIAKSPTQLSKLLFDVWGLNPIKLNVSKITGKTSRSTDKETLHELGLDDVRIRALHEHREALNNCTKFVDAPIKSVEYNEDGASHPLARVFSTYSGRLTYSSKQGKNKDERQIGFALHQEKNDPKFRCSVTTFPGHTLVEFDAAGQEFRWMAEASGDPTMRHVCAPGEDPHSYLGARIAKCDYRDLIKRVEAEEKIGKLQRKLGKVGNLSLQYRTSSKRLRSVARVQYDIPMEMPEADMIWTTYRETYPGVPKYWNQQIQRVRNLGYVETMAGRRVQMEGDWFGTKKWSLESTAINYRIQGTGADQKYLAIACLQNLLKKYKVIFLFDLHDGLYFNVPNDLVVAFCIEAKKVLDSLPYQKAWGFTPSIPMMWDCKTGPSWGDLKGLKL